jgi:hypothetical protein
VNTPITKKKGLAIFCLARGYKNWEIYKYFKLCIRNIFILHTLKRNVIRYDLIIFHEGNIHKSHQMFIKVFSLTRSIEFISVVDEFNLPPKFTQPEGVLNLGYVFMCRFNYLSVWNYLSNYETVMRIDDDVFLVEIDTQYSGGIFDYAFISNEAHEPTNVSLHAYLASKGKEDLYDHKFPYTNFYITKPEYWLRRDVQEFLADIGDRQEGINDRWGDATILGIALKEFQTWSHTRLRTDVKYLHMSHLSIVTNGLNVTLYSRISSRFPMIARIMRLALRFWRRLL